MFRFSFVLFFPLLSLSLSAQKKITLEDCFVQYKFYPQGGGKFHYLNDGLRYVQADEEGQLHVRDVRRPQVDSIIRLNLEGSGLEEYDQFTFSDDEKKVLLRTATQPVYRHSVLADYYVYDFATQHLTRVSEGEKIQHIEFSPDGDRLAYVQGNNLYIKDLVSGKTTAVTRDGAANQVINGLPDWVYEEEFSPVDGDGMVATRWSPDGSRLAFIRFDERAVREMQMIWYEGDMYPRYSRFKYPKVGERNSSVSVHLYDADGGGMVGEVMGLEADDYVPRLHFTRDNELVLTRLNRAQDTLELLVALEKRALYDSDGRKTYLPTRLLLRETDRAYVDVESDKKLLFLEDGLHFIWMSERSGYNHLYLYRTDGQLVRPLTQGSFDVTAFYGVDERNGKLYYQAATPSPMDRQLWEAPLREGAARLMTPPPGTHEAAFSPTFEVFLHTWSDANTPPVSSLCDRNDDTLRVLVKNERVRRLRSEYGFVNKEFFQFQLADGTYLNGWMMRPSPLEAGKKYPVLMDNYGGPGSQTVQNQYDGYLGSWHQMLVQQGYAVVSVDNRGTGGRGRDFKKCTQLQLGRYETEDQIAAARYLGTLPWVDAGRIGIWGWSFGGYLSTSCILKGHD
ncbi:MAG TPA: S9 family peptidase, partial [Saprospiraceae bacterium]|nr:S9 family peptidase [Saprospiraceae bacterium]